MPLQCHRNEKNPRSPVFSRAPGISDIIPTPQPEWGGMLSEGRNFISTNTNMTLFPGLAIMITVLTINMIGDGIRDAMDPRLKR